MNVDKDKYKDDVHKEDNSEASKIDKSVTKTSESEEAFTY